MTTTERDQEIDDLPEARDPLGAAVAQVIGCIFEALPDCPERRAARNANGWPTDGRRANPRPFAFNPG